MSDAPGDVLRRHGLRPKKSWGQNFLGDADVLERITEALELSPSDGVVELGAGLGHLTRKLLATGARVIAVERDRDMVAVLEELKDERLRVVAADAASVAFGAFGERVAVAGNLPYHLTSPILFQVLDQHAHVSRAVFTLQKEVADRLGAEPGGREYGLLTVLLGLHFRVETLFDVPARLFHPPPKVDSAVVRLTQLAKPRAEVRDEAQFRRLVKAGFGQRRKTLGNALKSLDAKEALAQAGIDPTRRAETLSVEEFAAIERAFNPSDAASSTPRRPSP